MIVRLRELMEKSRKRVEGEREGTGEERAWQMFLWGKIGWIGKLWKP
jgi:hypothetical protein